MGRSFPESNELCLVPRPTPKFFCENSSTACWVILQIVIETNGQSSRLRQIHTLIVGAYYFIVTVLLLMLLLMALKQCYVLYTRVFTIVVSKLADVDVCGLRALIGWVLLKWQNEYYCVTLGLEGALFCVNVCVCEQLWQSVLVITGHLGWPAGWAVEWNHINCATGLCYGLHTARALFVCINTWLLVQFSSSEVRCFQK